MTDDLDPLRDALAFARVTVRGDRAAIDTILDNADPSLMAAALLALYTDEWRRGLPSYEATNDDLDAHLARMQAPAPRPSGAGLGDEHQTLQQRNQALLCSTAT